jgi:hypothetical protein
MSALESLRNTIIITFSSLDTLLISFIGFIALTLGNIGTLFLLFGHVTVVPVITLLGQEFIKVSDKDKTTSSLIASDPITGNAIDVGNNVPTFWMANVMFFLGYIFGNAYFAYTAVSKLSESLKNSWFIDAQKTRSFTIMMMSVIIICATAFARLRTGFESLSGVWTIPFFVLLGWMWYYLASLCGARFADIFGMATQPIVAYEDPQKPTTCVYTPKS